MLNNGEISCSPVGSEEDEQDVSGTELSVVKLIVGPDREIFEVQEDLLCKRCPFFLNAFTGDFIESKTKTFTFPDDDASRFSDLCAWLKAGSLKEVQPDQSWIWLAKLWLFADKYYIDELQNEVIDVIHAKFAAHRDGVNISSETLEFVVENTFERSPLRRIFADMLTNGISLQQLPHRMENIPAEFLQDMCLAMKTMLSTNGPTNTSLLTHPISTYYSSSSACKSIAGPKTPDASDIPALIYCGGEICAQKDGPQPIRETLHMCSNHNITLCDDCRNSHSYRRHRKKMISLTSPPYQSAITGERTTIIDGHMNDHGFYCDGPDCLGHGHGRDSVARLESWALLSGDRYHCLDCDNIDYCSLCIRGPLTCKDDGHRMLRIRPTYARKIALTEQVSISVKQERSQKGLCWRCGGEHGTLDCETEKPVLGSDVEVED